MDEKQTNSNEAAVSFFKNLSKPALIGIIAAAVALVVVIALVIGLAVGGKDNGNGGDNNPPIGDNGGDDTNTDNTYTITVVDGANNPVAGVKVMTDPGFKTYTSDAQGKITFESDKTGIKIAVLSAPEGYEYSSDPVSFKSDSKELTIKVTKAADERVTYTVTVVDQNGDAVVGAGVQLCYNGICLPSVNTDDNGTMTNLIKDGYEVSVLLTLPSGYSATPVSGDYHAVIPEGQTEITITVTKN